LITKVPGRRHGIIWHDDGATSNIHKVDHSFLDRRSLAFHVAIAEKLRKDPMLLEKVRDRLRGMLSDDRVSISTRDAYREWLDVIEQRSFEEVLTLLVDPSEDGTRLRQATPFAGILSKAEHEAIVRKMPSIH
jgi:hypothetical protein